MSVARLNLIRFIKYLKKNLNIEPMNFNIATYNIYKIVYALAYFGRFCITVKAYEVPRRCFNL